MKRWHLLFLIIITIVFISGCTIELKATDIEAKGSVSGRYRVDGLHFTERGPLWHSLDMAGESSKSEVPSQGTPIPETVPVITSELAQLR